MNYVLCIYGRTVPTSAGFAFAFAGKPSADYKD